MRITERAADWPKDLPPGTYAMHAHYMELVEMWNSRIYAPLSLANVDTVSEHHGHSVIEFGNAISGQAFIDTFQLDRIVEARQNDENISWVRLRNVFPERAANKFFAALDSHRCDLLNLTNEWENLRPSLNSVFAKSDKIRHGIQEAHDAITKARFELGNSPKLEGFE